MITFKAFLTENNSLAVVPDNLSDLSLEQFLDKLTKDPKTGRPYTLKEFADKASWLSLYMGNKYGIGSSRENKDELLSELIVMLSTYFHQRILWPKIQPLRDKIQEYYSTPEYKSYYTKRNELFKAIMTARRNGEDTSDLYKQKSALEDNSPASEHVGKLEAAIDQISEKTKETPITSEFFEPNDPVNGETFTKIYNLFESLK